MDLGLRDDRYNILRTKLWADVLRVFDVRGVISLPLRDRDRAFGVLVEAPALLGQRDPPRRANEQRGTELGFEGRELPADRRDRNPQRRAPDAQDHRQEGRDLGSFPFVNLKNDK